MKNGFFGEFTFSKLLYFQVVVHGTPLYFHVGEAMEAKLDALYAVCLIACKTTLTGAHQMDNQLSIYNGN